MNEWQKQLANLWEHVARYKPYVRQSPVLEYIRTELDEMLAQATEDRYPPQVDFDARIAKHLGWEYYGPIMMQQIEGEWCITNADCEGWADLNLFGRRDYFAQDWHWMVNGVTTALTEKRQFQALCRYKENGGLKREHVLLVQRMRFEVDMLRGDWTSLFVQGKRPFGNSAREYDMLEIVGHPMPWLNLPEDSEEDPEMPDEIGEQMWDLFDELPFAMYDMTTRLVEQMSAQEPTP